MALTQGHLCDRLLRIMCGKNIESSQVIHFTAPYFVTLVRVGSDVMAFLKQSPDKCLSLLWL